MLAPAKTHPPSSDSSAPGPSTLPLCLHTFYPPSQFPPPSSPQPLPAPLLKGKTTVLKAPSAQQELKASPWASNFSSFSGFVSRLPFPAGVDCFWARPQPFEVCVSSSSPIYTEQSSSGMGSNTGKWYSTGRFLLLLFVCFVFETVTSSTKGRKTSYPASCCY